MGVACALALTFAVLALAGLAAGGLGSPSAAVAKPVSGAPHATHQRARDARRPFSRSAHRAKRRRALRLRERALKHPRLNLKSSFIHRLQAAAAAVPFTVRLRQTYEGGLGDDVLQLDWDTSAIAWPLAGTAPAADPVTSNLSGAFSYVWDYGADTTGYAEMGTVETRIGSAVSMQGTGFDIAGPGPDPCETTASLTSTGMALTAADVRFGTVNPFSRQVNGTLSLRTNIRTEATPCAGGDPLVATTATADPDRPLPVAFTGTFTVSPGITSDGHFRFGLLTVDDVTTPQRTTFGLVYACADPTAPDGCGRQAFPVRTKLLHLTAEVVAGSAVPGPPSIPDPVTTTTTPAETTTTTTDSTVTPASTTVDPAASVLGP